MSTRRLFAVFDIDGTLIRWQLYHAIADALAKRGLIDAKTYQFIRDARMVWKRRTHGEAFSAYQSELVVAYEKLLLDLSYKDFKKAVNAVFNEYKDQVYTYTRELVKRLNMDKEVKDKLVKAAWVRAWFKAWMYVNSGMLFSLLFGRRFFATA